MGELAPTFRPQIRGGCARWARRGSDSRGSVRWQLFAEEASWRTVWLRYGGCFWKEREAHGEDGTNAALPPVSEVAASAATAESAAFMSVNFVPPHLLILKRGTANCRHGIEKFLKVRIALATKRATQPRATGREQNRGPRAAGPELAGRLPAARHRPGWHRRGALRLARGGSTWRTRRPKPSQAANPGLPPRV